MCVSTVYKHTHIEGHVTTHVINIYTWLCKK